MSDWLLLVLVPLAAAYLVVCVAVFRRSQYRRQDPWKHVKRRKR